MNDTAHGGHFSDTRWTRVLAAADKENPGAEEALAALCQTYWPPLYSYARRKGHSPADAEDLTQGFFAQLLRLDSLARVRRERGRFRTFLLAAMGNYLADDHGRQNAAKRGAGKVVSIDAREAERGFLREPVAADLAPDEAFDKAWALALLQTVAGKLEQDYEAAGQGDLFRKLSFSLAGGRSEVPYSSLAAELEMNEPAVRVAVHRLRSRYRALLRMEIAETVAEAGEVDEELRELRIALSK
jgi:RNA polymerase sigma-70 factor (ECF subfamily)